ncbi:hypothetical protein ACS0PU_004013 [Formica fusca]
MKRTTKTIESIEKLEKGIEGKRRKPGEWTQGTVARTLLSGFSKRCARPPGGSSAVVCGAECGVRFHPLRPFVRIFPSVVGVKEDHQHLRPIPQKLAAQPRQGRPLTV